MKPDGLVVGNTLDVYQTDDPVHLACHRLNRERGRMSGLLTLRIKFEDIGSTTSFVSPTELTDLVERAGWRAEEMTEPNPLYLAALRPA